MTLTDEDRRFVDELGRILALLADTILRAVDVYMRDDQADREAITAQLLTVATAFRLVDAYRDVIDVLPPEHDPRPALAVLRTVQDSLTLSLSDDPRDRSRRITEEELRERLRAEPVTRFLDLTGTT
jgi:hypothetical protein